MANFELNKVNEDHSLAQQFKTAFQKATGQQVVAIITGKIKKIAGEATKDLDFQLENGQAVTLVVRTDGDIVRVKLNGKDLPLKNELWHFSPDSYQFTASTPTMGLPMNNQDRFSHASVFAKAVNEIAERVRANQAAFDKRMAGQKVNIPKPAGQRSGGSVTAQSKEVKLRISSIDERITQKKALRDDLQQQLSTRQQQADLINTPVGNA